MRILVHADDCGLTRGVTANILDCARAGALSGSAVMAGGGWHQEAARELAALLPPRDGISPLGVHLNLFEGEACAPAGRIPLLVQPDGIFRHGLKSFCGAVLFSSAKRRLALLEQVELEFSAQIERVLSCVPGARVYLDGHLHVHAFPPLRGVLSTLLAKYPVDYVRVPAEPLYALSAPLGLRLAGELRRGLLAFWSAGLPRMLDARGVRHSDCFIGAFASGFMDLPRLEAGLAHAAKTRPADALVEIMTHPGGLAPEEGKACGSVAYMQFYASERRTTEKSMLLSPAFHALMRRHDATWPGGEPC